MRHGQLQAGDLTSERRQNERQPDVDGDGGAEKTQRGVDTPIRQSQRSRGEDGVFSASEDVLGSVLYYILTAS